MWSANDVRALRQQLNVSQADFARLVGVDTRTVARWEAGTARPTGAAEAVLVALREKLSKDPDEAAAVAAFVIGAVAVGGLAYLLVKLLDSATERS